MTSFGGSGAGGVGAGGAASTAAGMGSGTGVDGAATGGLGLLANHSASRVVNSGADAERVKPAALLGAGDAAPASLFWTRRRRESRPSPACTERAAQECLSSKRSEL